MRPDLARGRSRRTPSAMAASPPARSPVRRVARNAGFRAAGEILGKLATLALMAALARSVGRHGLGIFVFGLAWAELSTVLLGPGIGRLVSRWIARDRGRVAELVPGALGVQLRRAVPL